jgi:hypothetical protein
MLSSEGFLQWCGRPRLSQKARQVVETVRSAGPARRVGGGRDNVSGRYPSRKMGVTKRRTTFRGFEILSRGKHSSAVTMDGAPPLPDVFLKGSGIYAAHLNADNPLGTVQSLEHALRALDKLAVQEQDHISRLEKTLSDYQAQANRPFEQEGRLKELLAARRNCMLLWIWTRACCRRPSPPSMKTTCGSRRPTARSAQNRRRIGRPSRTPVLPWVRTSQGRGIR